jgi:mRNA interferase HicA
MLHQPVRASTLTSAQFKRWLARQGCSFEPGKGGHLTVIRGNRRSSIPMHGSGKELKTGLVLAIKKQLGLV